jgi:phosphatidate cytidylyltransferase
MPAVIIGGIFYFILMFVFIVGATREYVLMFRAVKFEPQIHITVAGVGLILAVRMFEVRLGFEPFEASLPVFAALILAALAYHLIAYERGRNQAALDFGATVGALVYLGWIGAYLLDLRNLPEGGWWFMLVLPSVWLADSGAYSIGAAYGRHKMAPRLSPKKSWEGYAASVFTGAIGGAFLAYAYATFGNLGGDITVLQGGFLGLILGAITPLGDLGESMFKRQSGLKDSSDIMPGHGGFFDRIDSWLWGAVIGYYFLIWFIL